MQYHKTDIVKGDEVKFLHVPKLRYKAGIETNGTETKTLKGIKWVYGLKRKLNLRLMETT